LIRVTDRQKRAKATLTKPLTTHLTRGKGDFSCRESPWDWKICPKLLEIDPDLVKITLRVRWSRLLFKSYDKVGLYFSHEARNQASDRFISVHLTEYQDH